MPELTALTAGFLTELQAGADAVLRQAGRVDTADLVGSLTPQPVVQTSDGVAGRLVASAAHAATIHDGRQPGKAMPPKGSLVGWMTRKVGMSPEEALSKEFVFRRAVGRKGIPAVPFFADPLAELLPSFAARAAELGAAVAVSEIAGHIRGEA